MKHSSTVVVTLLLALLLWERIAPARADSARYDMTALVRAIEAQAKATQDVAREIREARRDCR